ncbi:hypothetical protein [Thiolapillus sp.]
MDYSPKTYLYLTVCALVFGSAASQAKEASLEGHWSCSLQNQGMKLPATFDFSANGDFQSSVTVMGSTTTERGDWKLAGDTLVLNHHTSVHNGKVKHKDYTLKREILEASGSKLVLKVGEGRYRCHR